MFFFSPLSPREVADAMEVRAAASAALDQVVELLRQGEALHLTTLEQAKAFTQFLSQFPDCGGNLCSVGIPAAVDERIAARIRRTLTMAGLKQQPLSFGFPK